MCAINGLLYVIGGDDGSCNLSSVEFYNPAADKWSLIPTNMSNGRSYAGEPLALGCWFWFVCTPTLCSLVSFSFQGCQLSTSCYDKELWWAGAHWLKWRAEVDIPSFKAALWEECLSALVTLSVCSPWWCVNHARLAAKMPSHALEMCHLLLLIIRGHKSSVKMAWAERAGFKGQAEWNEAVIQPGMWNHSVRTAGTECTISLLYYWFITHCKATSVIQAPCTLQGWNGPALSSLAIMYILHHSLQPQQHYCKLKQLAPLNILS